MMNKNNSTTYSIVGSLGVHVMFTLGAGSFLMNINNSVQPQKTYQLEFVKRKAPPAFKKETMRKEPLLKDGWVRDQGISFNLTSPFTITASEESIHLPADV